MEKRIFGIILTILGIVGLVLAGMNFMNGDNDAKMIAVYAILGIIFFFGELDYYAIQETKQPDAAIAPYLPILSESR